jgi:hypothetical protein
MMVSLPDLSDIKARTGLLVTYACALLRLLPVASLADWVRCRWPRNFSRNASVPGMNIYQDYQGLH